MFDVSFTPSDVVFDVDLEVSIGSSAPEYTGPYEVTPSREIQTLPTTNKHTLRSIIINPIPSNYGLITYNGFSITVS